MFFPVEAIVISLIEKSKKYARGTFHHIAGKHLPGRILRNLAHEVPY